MFSHNAYPWDEVFAEICAAAAQGDRYAKYHCYTCGASFISPRDAYNHNVPIFEPGLHVVREVDERTPA